MQHVPNLAGSNQSSQGHVTPTGWSGKLETTTIADSRSILLAGEPGPAPNQQDAETAIAAGAVPVICQGNRGLYLLERDKMACTCKTCSSSAERAGVPYHELDLIIFERHSGAQQSFSAGQPVIRIDNGTPQGGESLQHWLDQRYPSALRGMPSHSLRQTAGPWDYSRAANGGTMHSRPVAALPAPNTSLPSSTLIRPQQQGLRPRPPRNVAPALAAAAATVPLDGAEGMPVVNPNAATQKDDRFLQIHSAADKSKSKPTPTLREGQRYQATIPPFLAPQPKYGEDQDKRRGRKTEPIDVMSAAPIEKMRADQLPFDAVSDPEFHRSDGVDPRQLLLERNQRRRQKPSWLQNSVDPKSVRELRTIAALRAAGGEEELEAVISREESPMPAALSGRRTPNSTLPRTANLGATAPAEAAVQRKSGAMGPVALADAVLQRKRGPAEMDEAGPHKRSRYYPPALASQPPSPVFEEFAVPRRRRTGLLESGLDYLTAAAAAGAPPNEGGNRSPANHLSRRSRMNASVGPNGEGGQLLRVTDATGGGSSRRTRGGISNGWPRGSGSYNATRELAVKTGREGTHSNPAVTRWEVDDSILRLDVVLNGQVYIGALSCVHLPGVPRPLSMGDKVVERLAISSSPKDGNNALTLGDNDSPMAAQAGSRVGSEGPEPSATQSHDRKRKGGRADDPEFVPEQPRVRKSKVAPSGPTAAAPAVAAAAAAAAAAQAASVEITKASAAAAEAQATAENAPAEKHKEASVPPTLPAIRTTAAARDAEGDRAAKVAAAAKPGPSPTQEASLSPLAGEESPQGGGPPSQVAEPTPPPLPAVEAPPSGPPNGVVGQTSVDEAAAAMLAAASKPDRQAQAQAEYERLKRDGAPPTAKCTLCHCGEASHDRADADAGHASLERQASGLGPLLLVRVSAIANAWAHAQCLFWSPDIYVDHGQLAGLADAVRRGRMIKCKTCGQKGATLGCHHKSCRLSYHLQCARKSSCLVQGCGDDPYVVACPKHTRIVLEELDLAMPVDDEEGADEPAGMTLRRA
ncbi:hypothetical protein WJX73_010562 [Symbiochloris irregularis]|uniref:PHD-type domain-containing protein n=1 Tax=Symbiochloris irregularis TaxID=706552 RepID=A0AAW1PVQ4_9CHLO